MAFYGTRIRFNKSSTDNPNVHGCDARMFHSITSVGYKKISTSIRNNRKTNSCKQEAKFNKHQKRTLDFSLVTI